MRNAPLIMMALTTIILGAILLLARSMDSAPAAAGDGGMEAMSVDMDPAASPANTATSIGSRQDCARVNENDTLDADEEVAADSLEIDVTALNIPQANAMVSFSFTLLTRDAADTQTVPDRISIDMAGRSDDAYNDFFLLSVNAGSSIFNTNDALPDQDGVWTGSSLDIGPVSASEFGTGVLERMLVSSVPGAPAGQYILKLAGAFHADPGGPPAKLPNALNNGSVAIDTACSALPTPTPTPTPSPTPTPPGLTQGDVDCDNGSVTAVDALKVLRFVANLSVQQQPGCPPIGSEVASLFGDVDCDNGVSAVDALKILRFVANLSVQQQPSCPLIGNPL